MSSKELVFLSRKEEREFFRIKFTARQLRRRLKATVGERHSMVLLSFINSRLLLYDEVVTKKLSVEKAREMLDKTDIEAEARGLSPEDRRFIVNFTIQISPDWRVIRQGLIEKD